jgi:hypothetical protein
MPGFKDVLTCALTGCTPSEANYHAQQETGFDHFYAKPVDLSKSLSQKPNLLEGDVSEL